MINYSIYENDLIFENWEDFEPKYKIMKLSDGVKLEIEQINEENFKITQVLSSNPQDYLKTDLNPGTLIKSKFELK